MGKQVQFVQTFSFTVGKGNSWVVLYKLDYVFYTLLQIKQVA